MCTGLRTFKECNALQKRQVVIKHNDQLVTLFEKIPTYIKNKKSLVNLAQHKVYCGSIMSVNSQNIKETKMRKLPKFLPLYHHRLSSEVQFV